MDRKNLKISEVTHEYIVNQAHNSETMDETVQRLLGIGSDPDNIEQGMGAYLPDDMRAEVEELHFFIKALGTFETEYETDGGIRGGDAIRFVDGDTGITIAQIEMKEKSYGIQYRDSDGDLTWTDHGEIVRTQSRDLPEVKEAAERAIEGAMRRWGE